MSTPQVIVIGGGLAGLSAAVALSDSGFRVSLFEKSPRLGGRATSYALADGEYIDNCQHVTLRCCTNLENFYQRLGIADKIRYYDRLVFADSTGQRSIIEPSRLPAPLHLLPSFATFRLLNWKDKRCIARALLNIIRTSGQPELPHALTMHEWLKTQKQTRTSIDRFWRTVLVSALNEDLDRMDARYGIDVFWKAFLSNRKGFAIGIPAVPLAELYELANNRIDVRTRTGIAEILFSNGNVIGVKLDDGNELAANYYIVATNFDRMLKMMPPGLRDSEGFSGLAKLEVSPITSVHLWFDRQVMTDPFLTSVDQTIQWVFNKKNGQYLQIVISASYALREQSQADIVRLCRGELAKLLPATASVEPNRSIVIRENAATFSPQPGCDRWRPSQRTPFGNLFIAGDWTQTGWPATMEGAVRSGYQAAEAVLESEGRAERLVQPLLPTATLVRWLAN